MNVLGIDTSNYTTSLAEVNDAGYRQKRLILDVGEGKRGLRQSDALFLHTKNLPVLFEELCAKDVCAVAYSARPRDVEGSYMPCFLAGEAAARGIAATLGVPVYSFSHQAGHIEAAIRSCGKELDGEMLAFHVSGGTTELLFARPDKKIGYACEIIGGTRDISAGQLVDRVGVLLGLKFPCGGELEKLAGECTEKTPKAKVSADGAFCNLSGAENHISKMLSDGKSPAFVARFTLETVAATLVATSKAAREKYPSLPLLFAGGVMRNGAIKEAITQNFDNVYFAKAELSSDNAVGTAYLGLKKYKEAHNG